MDRDTDSDDACDADAADSDGTPTVSALPTCPVERAALADLSRLVRGVLREHLLPHETVRRVRPAVTRHLLEFRSAGEGIAFDHGEPTGVMHYVNACRKAGGRVTVDAGRAFEPGTRWAVELSDGDEMPVAVPFPLTLLIGVCVEEPAVRVAELVGRELARVSGKQGATLELWARRRDGLALWLRAEAGRIVSVTLAEPELAAG